MTTDVRQASDDKTPRDYRARVIVKFRDHIDLPYEDDIGDEVEAAGVGAWRDLASRFPGIRLLRLFDQTPAREIEAMVDEAVARDDTYRPPNLLTYFVVTCPPQVDAEQLAASVRQWKTVQDAYVEAGPTPPPVVNAADDPRSVNQRYLDPAPAGIDAEYAWTKPGGDGTGVGFIDLEQGWTLNHEDLAAAGITVISGTSTAYFGHGTAVLGEVVAVDNTLGCVGIAPQATTRVVSQYQPTGYNTSQAILSALAAMSFGDVLLLEAQTTFHGTTSFWPVEVETAVYDTIRLGSALGIVIVEAGGNGSHDLDTFTLGGLQVLNRAAGGAAFRDSGAIMVAAASASTPHTPLAFTNLGSRIDCYAWGEGIDTTGDGWTGNSTTVYMSGFGGTSGASPIIAGAAILLQSIAVATQGFRFSPRQLRALLADAGTGTLSVAPATDRIGVMPNLKSTIDNVLGLRPDVYLRDVVGDVGEPHVGAISSSPDVILRPTAVANPQASFGAGSGTENDSDLGFEAEAGQDNYLYVRALNQGGQPAANVTATVHWSPVSTLVTPNLWTLVGSVNIPNVPVGEILTVSDAITWPAADIPGPGHYCFVGLVSHPLDPAPTPVDFLNWSNFETFIRNNNNVTWRNFNVVNNVPPAGAEPPGYVPLEFLVAGAPDAARQFALEVVARLPEGAELFLEVPTFLIKRQEIYQRQPVADDRLLREDNGSCDVAIVSVSAHGRNRFDDLQLAANATFRCRLLAAIPEDLRKESFEVYARQLYEDREVGRVTWRLAPPRDER